MNKKENPMKVGAIGIGYKKSLKEPGIAGKLVTDFKENGTYKFERADSKRVVKVRYFKPEIAEVVSVPGLPDPLTAKDFGMEPAADSRIPFDKAAIPDVAQKAYEMFVIINKDCKEAGEEERDFSDTEYYSLQIQNIYCVSPEDADEIAQRIKDIADAAIKTPVAKKVNAMVKMALLETLISAATYTKAEICQKMLETFPEMKQSTLDTILSDGQNTKYNKFPKLVIVTKTEKGKIYSFQKEA